MIKVSGHTRRLKSLCLTRKNESRRKETERNWNKSRTLLFTSFFSEFYIYPPSPHQRGRLDTDSQALEGEDLLDDMLTAPSSATLRTDTPTNDDEVHVGR